MPKHKPGYTEDADSDQQRDALAHDPKKHDYYYDDAHGYEKFVNNDEQEEPDEEPDPLNSISSDVR